jgi:hypothetical protein
VVTVAAVDDDLVEPTQLMTRLTAGVVQSTDANYDALTDEGELWSAPVNVTSDDEGCGDNSNRVYYAAVHEENARDDDPNLTTYVRPEPAFGQ